MKQNNNKMIVYIQAVFQELNLTINKIVGGTLQLI